MNLDQLYPYGFRITLFDRLLPETDQNDRGISLQELRESVASDLEDLLNSRIAKLDHLIDQFPLAKQSILQFGIIDFVGLRLLIQAIGTKFVNLLSNRLLRMNPGLNKLKSRCYSTVKIWGLYI